MRKIINKKSLKKCKNDTFSKRSIFVKTCSNWILSSGKNSYWANEPEFKNWEKFTWPIFWYSKKSKEGGVFSSSQKGQKMDFTRYLIEKSLYELLNMWEKNLWSTPIITPNIFEIELKFKKISRFVTTPFFSTSR